MVYLTTFVSWSSFGSRCASITWGCVFFVGPPKKEGLIFQLLIFVGKKHEILQVQYILINFCTFLMTYYEIVNLPHDFFCRLIRWPPNVKIQSVVLGWCIIYRSWRCMVCLSDSTTYLVLEMSRVSRWKWCNTYNRVAGCWFDSTRTPEGRLVLETCNSPGILREKRTSASHFCWYRLH